VAHKGGALVQGGPGPRISLKETFHLSWRCFHFFQERGASFQGGREFEGESVSFSEECGWSVLDTLLDDVERQGGRAHLMRRGP
jgi:hypothetical protein